LIPKPIYKICPHCSTQFPLKDEYLYNTFSCPFCSKPLTLKSQGTVIYEDTGDIDPKEVV
jgi:transcription initiation factor IIE alpha subunit